MVREQREGPDTAGKRGIRTTSLTPVPHSDSRPEEDGKMAGDYPNYSLYYGHEMLLFKAEK